MENSVIEEVRRDVFEHPKPTIDLDYLYSVKRQIQEFADATNAQLKKNVYQNYSLFIESSTEISSLKSEMGQLNTLLENQQSSMSKLLEQLNKTPIIQPNLERPKVDPFRLLSSDASEVEAEILPTWLIKCPEDFDVLVAQRNLKEAVELAQKVKAHIEQYPKCFDNNQTDLKHKIENRLEELISAICSELQPATDRSVQGGPRSSINSINLLKELNLSSRAVKLYLDQRSSVLRFVLSQQKVESTRTIQYIKQLCSIFFHNTIETCSEFKQAFELDKHIDEALEESIEKLGMDVCRRCQNEPKLLSDLVKPIYESRHPPIEHRSPKCPNGNDISSQILSHAEKMVETATTASPSRNVFYHLSYYASLTHWILQEFENFIHLFRKHVFNNPQLSVSMTAESVYHLRNQCAKMAIYCEIDLSQIIQRELSEEIKHVVDDSGRKLVETIRKLNNDEQWQPQQFQNKAQLTRFFEEMNDVDLKTMPSYIFEDLKLRFTACKTSFARYFLVTVNDLAKLVSPSNKDHIDRVLAEAFELQMESVVEALKRVKVTSKVRFIMGNSNFLLDKVILVADAHYNSSTGLQCQKFADLRNRYKLLVKAAANM